jgi:16S rRNA (cytosine967-C5)-methyltransferase
MPVSPARVAAFDILLRIDNTDAYASELLHSSRFAKLSPADHGLLTELVMGVLRWRSLLDRRIGEHSAQPLTKMDLEVLTALRLGAHQLLFLERIPKHAAVNDSVELVKQARKRSAAGMVNAILRKIHKREISHSDEISAHPRWIIERWTRIYSRDITNSICAYDQIVPKTTIRFTTSALVEELRSEGITLQLGRLLANSFTVEAGEITQTKAFRERRLIIQDEASQLVALLAGRGASILDCCAAPGGKTRILAEQNQQSAVVAMELHPHRAELLKKLVRAKNVRVIAADVRKIPLAAKFERVLVDAPCSGTGTLARNPEIKWRLQPKDISRLQDYQTEILLSAMNHVAPGGRLIYSTCSLESEENSQVIERVLASDSSFHVIDCRDELLRLKRDGDLTTNDIDSLLSGPYLRTIPGVHACDGFFAAIIERE